MIAKPLATAETIPEDWPAIVRKIVVDGGYAIRAKADAPMIEVKSLTTNKWCVLLLPGGGTAFESSLLRDEILRQIFARPA
jgi:hypothetical protein